MGWMKKRAAAAGGNFLYALFGFVTAIVMLVSGNECHDPGTVADNFLFQISQVVLVKVCVVLAVKLCIDPMRFGGADDYLIPRLHVRSDQSEILDLGDIYIRIQLHVGAEQPPTAGQT